MNTFNAVYIKDFIQAIHPTKECTSIPRHTPSPKKANNIEKWKSAFFLMSENHLLHV